MCFLKKFHLKWYFRIFFWTLVDNWLVVISKIFLMFIPIWENVTNLTSIFFSNQLVIASFLVVLATTVGSGFIMQSPNEGKDVLPGFFSGKNTANWVIICYQAHLILLKLKNP